MNRSFVLGYIPLGEINCTFNKKCSTMYHVHRNGFCYCYPKLHPMITGKMYILNNN